MSKYTFLHSTPKDLDIFLDGKLEEDKFEAKRSDYNAWLNGFYIRLAVSSVLSKKAKYPKRPIDSQDEDSFEENDHIVATEAMSEEEKERTRQLFLQNLQSMQKQFEEGRN